MRKIDLYRFDASDWKIFVKPAIFFYIAEVIFLVNYFIIHRSVCFLFGNEEISYKKKLNIRYRKFDRDRWKNDKAELFELDERIEAIYNEYDTKEGDNF